VQKLNYTLDACALLAFLDDEEGADVVAELFQRAENGEIAIFMSIVNLIEVYYGRIRKKSPDKVAQFLQAMNYFPITVIDTISPPVYHEAARLKGAHKMALGDAIGLAAAKSLDAAFVTSDHNELDAVEQKETLNFLWIRPPGPKK
jgi:predicted nucleic acid-binding protein